MEPILNERDSHNGVNNDHQAMDNVPQAADYPPEIPDHGNQREFDLFIRFYSSIFSHFSLSLSLHFFVVAFCVAGDVGAIEAAPAVEEPLEVSPQRQYSLDDFELIRVIGRGSYAKVLMVELKRTKRIYAMKVIKKALVTDDEDIDWVQTEKHVFETASNHPFLVGLHSCFQTPSRLFFVIEFVRGGDLMFHMQRQRRLPEEHARFYAAEISLALNFLHEKVSQLNCHGNTNFLSFCLEEPNKDEQPLLNQLENTNTFPFCRGSFIEI